jgi:hypothetical protein
MGELPYWKIGSGKQLCQLTVFYNHMHQHTTKFTGHLYWFKATERNGLVCLQLVYHARPNIIINNLVEIRIRKKFSVCSSS